MYVHQAKPANADRTTTSSSVMGILREQFRLPSNQRAAVCVSIAHQILLRRSEVGITKDQSSRARDGARDGERGAGIVSIRTPDDRGLNYPRWKN
jgi:hypothetical protein